MADKPVTREEKYLAYLTGDYKGELPKPITRKEKYLYELCLKGIGGEISQEEIKNAVNEYLENNPVKPGATAEQAQQIEQNKIDIASLKTETGSLKEDLDTLFENIIPLFSNVAYTSDGMNVYLDNLKNRVNQNPQPEPALYSFVNGTHTFADGSVLTVSNGNHVKYKCTSTITNGMNNGTPLAFGVSDIIDADYGANLYGVVNSAIMSPSRFSSKAMFTIDSGDEVEVRVKNIKPNNGSHEYVFVIRKVGINGSNIIKDSLIINANAGDTISRVFIQDVTTPIAPFCIVFDRSNKGVTYEFDVELLVNGMRYI